MQVSIKFKNKRIKVNKVLFIVDFDKKVYIRDLYIFEKLSVNNVKFY